MLKYSHGLKYDLTPLSRPDNFQLNELANQGPRDVNDRSLVSGSRSQTPRNFWKSPYAGSNSIFRNGITGSKNIFLNPNLSLDTSPLTSRTLSRDEHRTVRSILKNKNGECSNHVTSQLDETPRSSYGKLNLITTGTSDVQPHGARPEAKSAGKRVQFNNLPKPLPKPKNFLTLPIGSATSNRGRRLYFNKTVAVRVLGTPNYSTKYGGTSSDRHMATTSLNGGESYIKSQINDFVKKLRLAESAKVRQESCNRRTSSSSNNKLRYTDDADTWGEFDLERQLENSGNGNETALGNDKSVFTDGDDDAAESGSVSLESLDSPSDTNIAENTPGGAEVYRRRTPMAALFTKYRHITNNKPDMRRYEKRSVISETISDGSSSKSTNFCDNDKTSQILGWLEDMKSAQNTRDGGKVSMRDLPKKETSGEDPLTRVARANTPSRVKKESKRTEQSG